MVFCIMAQTRSSTCPKQHKSVEQDRVEGQSEQISVSAAEVGCAQEVMAGRAWPSRARANLASSRWTFSNPPPTRHPCRANPG